MVVDKLIFLEIVREGYKGIKHLTAFLGKKAKEAAMEYDLFGKLYSNYRKKLEEDCDVIQILGSNPHPLRGLFIHVNILERILRQNYRKCSEKTSEVLERSSMPGPARMFLTRNRN